MPTPTEPKNPARSDLVGRRIWVATTLATRLRQWLPDDPAWSSVRRATRAALVIPVAFAFAKVVIGDAQVTTFVAFGCFALLVMADFGGARRLRALAFVTTTLVGVVLVTLGTLASPVAWVAAVSMLLVGFGVQLTGVFGGYVAAAQTALLLAFVLAVAVPAPPSAVGTRLLGWLIAGVVSTLAGVFFWPRFEQLALRRQAAEACRALAQLIGTQHGRQVGMDVARQRAVARTAVEAVRRLDTASPKRPAGPTRRDRAFVELLTELERTREFAARPFRLQLTPVHPCIEAGNKLAAAVVQTLEASADALTGGTPPDLLALDAARLAHREALDRWAGEALRAGRAPEDVLAGLDVDHALRVVSYLAPGSSVLHHSLRVGMGLALAVLLARLLRLDHALWVVLATLSVLRSNAFGTGRTTVQALLGTSAGVAIGALFTAVVGAGSGILWVALPVAVFLATNAASALGFVIGQAAFTMLVIILFNLIAPVGWQVGLARIEDVAVGVGISVIVGLLLWPRGARGELAAAVAGLYRAVLAFLASSFDRVLAGGSPEDAGRQRRLTVRARDRAGEEFDRFLYERGAKPLDPETGAFLVAAGTHAILAADLLNVLADMGYQARGSSDGITALHSQAQLVLASFTRLADRLDGTTRATGAAEGVSDDVLREAALSCPRRGREDSGGGRTAMAVVMVGEWIQQLGELAADLEAPVAQAVKAVRVPWWR